MPKKEKPVEKTAEEIRAEQEARGDFVEESGDGAISSASAAEDGDDDDDGSGESTAAGAESDVPEETEEGSAEVEEVEAAAEEEEEVDEPVLPLRFPVHRRQVQQGHAVRRSSEERGAEYRLHLEVRCSAG